MIKYILIFGCISISMLTVGCSDRNRVQDEKLADLQKRLTLAERNNELILEKLEEIGSRIDGEVEKQVDLAMKVYREEVETFEHREGAGQGKEWRRNFEARRKDMEERRLEDLADKLGLKEEQKEKVRELADAMKKTIQGAVQKMREEGGFNLETVRRATEELKNTGDAGMREILTDEQYRKYREMPNPVDMIHRFLKGGKGSVPGPEGAEMEKAPEEMPQ